MEPQQYLVKADDLRPVCRILGRSARMQRRDSRFDGIDWTGMKSIDHRIYGPQWCSRS
jgi:hypothetical protein